MAYYQNYSNLSETQDELTEDELQVELVISIISIVVGSLSVILNVMFLFTTRYLKERQTASSVYHTFMKNLSWADILACTSFLLIQNWTEGALGYIESSHFMLVDVLPYIFRSTPWMFFTAYLLTLLCLTVNQYIAVCRPLKYTALMTNHRTVVCVSLILVWGISSLQIVIPFIILSVLYSYRDKVFRSGSLHLVSRIEMQCWMSLFAITTIGNIILGSLVYREIRKLRGDRSARTNDQNTKTDTYNLRMKEDAFVTVSMLLLTSVVCRLPFPLVGIIEINVQVMRNAAVSRITNSVLALLLYLNFFSDPIIYFWRMREIRHSYKVMFRKLTCRGTRDLDEDDQRMEVTGRASVTEAATMKLLNGGGKEESTGGVMVTAI